MTFWQTVCTVTLIAFFSTRAGTLLYWRLHGKKRGSLKPSWRDAWSEAWSAFLASTISLAMYLAGKG